MALWPKVLVHIGGSNIRDQPSSVRPNFGRTFLQRMAENSVRLVSDDGQVRSITRFGQRFGQGISE